MPNSHIGERIKKYRKFKNLTAVELSKTLGIKQPSLSQIETGKSDPSAETILTLVRETDISSKFLLEGIEPIIKLKPSKEDHLSHFDFDKKELERDTVREPGEEYATVEVEVHETTWEGDKVNVPKEWRFPGMVAVKIVGDSMEPALVEGAVAGIDTTQRKPRSGKLYAIHIPFEGVLIKRVFVEPKKVMAYSDNSAYKPFELDEHDLEEGRIIGRVVWALQKFD